MERYVLTTTRSKRRALNVAHSCHCSRDNIATFNICFLCARTWPVLDVWAMAVGLLRVVRGLRQ